MNNNTGNNGVKKNVNELYKEKREEIKQTLAKIGKFPEGSIILQEGEVNLDMYKIIKGHAELYTGYGTDQEVLLGIIGPQSVFGEFGLLLRKPAIYTVVAYSDVYALRVTEGDMGDFVQENHKYIIDIMRNMANMMMVMQTQINMLTSELKDGKEPDPELCKQISRNIRKYAMYNSNEPWDEFSNMINIPS